MAKIPQEYTGTFIPAIIMLNTNLKPMEKMLYAEIASFRQCYASNAWFAERLGISDRTVRTGIKKLKDMRLITVHETATSRICVSSVLEIQRVEKIATPQENSSTPQEKIAYKNNNKNNNKELEHTSSLREDESVPVSLPASSSAGDGNNDSPDESAARAAHLQKVFDAIVKIVHEGRPILYTDTRKSRLNARLKTFKPSELILAAKHLMQSDWHVGMNPQKKVYASFDFLIRNDEQVEKWLNEKPVSKPKSVF